MDLSAAFQTPQTGDLCIVKDIIQQDSRDHEFVDPEAKKAENATSWHSGVTYFSDVFTYLIFLRAYNQEDELDGFTTSFVSNTKPQYSWSCSPKVTQSIRNAGTESSALGCQVSRIFWPQ